VAFFSYSKLEKYAQCSEFYRLYYLDKSVPRPDTSSIHTVVGNICHEVLEDYYGRIQAGVDAESVEALLTRWWQNELARIGLLGSWPELTRYAQDLMQLHARASAHYTGLDAIRTSAGKVPEKPERTTIWQRAAAELQLDSRLAALNVAVRAVVTDGHWVKYSLPDVMAETHRILTGYRDPVAGCRIEQIEYALSEYDEEFKRIRNAVIFPGTDAHLNGFIDLVVTDGYNRIYIIDHKTSKEAPSAAKVSHWEQLLLYGWAWHRVTGQVPDVIAINHLRSKQLICAPFDLARAEEAVSRKMKQIDAVAKEVFIPQNPTDFGSACFNAYTKEPCGYLAHCHPTYAALLQADLNPQPAANAVR
jgi:RecB family exonuclease